MDPHRAFRLLGLEASATPEEIDAAMRRMLGEMDARIEGAATEASKAKCQAERRELERAAEALGVKGTDDGAEGLRQPEGQQATAQRSPDGASQPDHARRTEFCPFSEGQLVAERYEIRRPLSTGGMSAVYAAFDRRQNQDVAIKVFHPELLRDVHATGLLLRGAELASHLDHPGIARIMESRKEGELHFVVMGLLEGVTLRQKMAELSVTRQPFSVHEVVRVGAALSNALAYAHQHTVHCGVRPENIFLCDDGRVKLTDFGIARAFDVNKLTTIGLSRGTTFYLAPEQLRGAQTIDGRVDQYATAAVLYEMLTGQAPAGRVKPARRRRPDTPWRLSRALDRALAPDPTERFADMKRFAIAVTGHSTSPNRRRVALAVLVSIACVAVVGGTYPMWRDSVRGIVQRGLPDPQGQDAAEGARVRALTAASEWNRITGLLSDDQPTDRIARAEAAFAAGDEYLEAMAYDEATESFLTASELYELLTAAATQTLREGASRAAHAARRLYDRLERLERELYDRTAESARRVQSSEQSRRGARTETERAERDARWREAKSELELMNRLKSLAHAHVFDLPWRTEIDDRLGQADRDLKNARYTGVISSYAEATSRLEGLLAWPEKAEAALRQQSALGNGLDMFRASLGPMAMKLADVQVALAETAARIDGADRELTAGNLSEATAMHASARESLDRAKAQAVAELLSQAMRHEDEGQPGTALLALEELFALEPTHSEAKELRRKILSRPLINSIQMEFVLIPPGEFIMGSPSTELGRDDDERQRRVQIARAFYIATTEVTQSEWLAVTGDNPSRWKGDDLPVEQVAWEDALEFCRRLSDKEDRTYRLPTEEEWEYACRAGTTTPFHFGETISPDQANYDSEYAYGHGTVGAFRNQTTPVREFPPNAWGLYDMHGNVWEWCPDSYEYYTPSPVKPSVGANPIEGRVLRGGSWRNRPTYCRCANRVRDAVGSPLSNVGFRVVLETD